MPAVLITGANRGLGLEFVRQYRARDWRVIACTRDPEAPVLAELADDGLRVYPLDVTDHAAVDALAEALGDQPIDVLVNNAGGMGPKAFPACADYSGIDNTDYAIWRQILEVNLLGAFKVATALRPLLAASERRVLVNMSSDLGSMTQNTRGGFYNYRTSKAALNMVTRGLASEWPDIICVSMAPGWCATDLGGADAHIDPADSVAVQIDTIEGLTPANSGCFIDRFGNEVPW